MTSAFGLFVLALVMVLNFAPISGLMLPDDHAFREVLAGQAMINMIFIIAGGEAPNQSVAPASLVPEPGVHVPTMAAHLCSPVASLIP